jgi:hypothetical protein
VVEISVITIIAVLICITVGHIKLLGNLPGPGSSRLNSLTSRTAFNDAIQQ